MRFAVIAALTVLPMIASEIPVYPNSQKKPENRDPLRTVSTDDLTVHYLSASAWISPDAPAKLLAFYREKLRSYGVVTECRGGTNTDVDVLLRARTGCDASSVGVNGTELRVARAGEEHIVVVRPSAGGSEFALVHVLMK